MMKTRIDECEGPAAEDGDGKAYADDDIFDGWNGEEAFDDLGGYRVSLSAGQVAPFPTASDLCSFRRYLQSSDAAQDIQTSR